MYVVAGGTRVVEAVPMASNVGAKLHTFRVTFEDSDRVERVRASAYRSDPPWVEFLVEEGDGLVLDQRVVARFDGNLLARITTTG